MSFVGTYELQSICMTLMWLFWGFPKYFDGSDSKESACNAGDLNSIPESGRYPGEGNGNPLQYSCRETSMDRPGGHKEPDTT